MNPFVFPVEPVAIDSLESMPYRVQFLLHHICNELRQHDLWVWIPKKFCPTNHNFKVYKKGLIGDHSDDVVCERFHTLDELNDSVGYCIRQHGRYEASGRYIEDEFLPFSGLLAKRDENFKWWLEHELQFIHALSNLSMHSKRAQAMSMDAWDEKLSELYNNWDKAEDAFIKTQNKIITSSRFGNKSSALHEEELTKNQEASEKAYQEFFRVLYSRLSPLRK